MYNSLKNLDVVANICTPRLVVRSRCYYLIHFLKRWWQRRRPFPVFHRNSSHFFANANVNVENCAIEQKSNCSIFDTSKQKVSYLFIIEKYKWELRISFDKLYSRFYRCHKIWILGYSYVCSTAHTCRAYIFSRGISSRTIFYIGKDVLRFFILAIHCLQARRYISYLYKKEWKKRKAR